MAKKYESTAVRRQQIADAALDVIAELGLPAFTTRTVAARVNISDGTIFRHFKSKEEIILAALDRLEARLFADVPEPSPPTDPLVVLADFFRRRAEMLGGSAPMGRLIFSDQLVHAAGQAGVERIRALRNRNVQLIVDWLTQLSAAGRLRGEIAIGDAMVLIQGTLLTFAFGRVLSEGGIGDLDTVIRRRWQVGSRAHPRRHRQRHRAPV